MVIKKSEYQNQFKSSVVAKNQCIYQENLTFRHNRRDKEFIHTPISWYDQNDDNVSSSEEETNENFNCNIISKSENKCDEPEYHSLAEILDKSKARSIALKKQRKEDFTSKDLPEIFTIGRLSLEDGDSGLQKIVSDSGDNNEECKDTCQKILLNKSTKNESIVDDLKEQQHNEKILKSKSNLRKTKTKKRSPPHPKHTFDTSTLESKGQLADSHIPVLPICTKLRRPDRQRRIPSAKYRPVSQERPPFLAYGAGDKEYTFTTHRTHNVRSTVDVYDPALKAKIRREEDKKRQMERQRRLAQSTSDILEKLASATPRDMFDWRSEYQKQFHGYEPKEYERSTSSRAVIPHSAPIRAVHRGGSLIVHVD